jgi:hypothetical protein
MATCVNVNVSSVAPHPFECAPGTTLNHVSDIDINITQESCCSQR